jgi:hypothetical protein
VNSLTISVAIAAAPQTVYEYAGDPRNLPHWAAGLAQSVEQVDGEWVAHTATAALKVRFVDKNALGVLDHYVGLPSGEEVYCPMRVIADAGGSLLLFTLYQRPDMTDEQFTTDAELVAADLEVLKGVIESR